ncbi:MAG: redoxin domain-containing protein [Isosphaeraceae bacterium]
MSRNPCPRSFAVAVALAALTVGINSRADESVSVGRLQGAGGKSIPLDAPKGGATALVFLSTECPISNGYSPTLNALAKEFPKAALNLVGVCVDPDLTDDDVAKHAKEYELTFPVGRDRRGTLAAKLGATVTPEAVVLDDQGKIRYRGRIDDQYAARQKRNQNPRTQELRDAIAAVTTGREVKIPRTEAVGCPLPEVDQAAVAPTYSDDVAPILAKNCQECHRPGQVGPFSLATYNQARKRATDIAAVAEARTMPPWKPDPHFGPKFKNSKALSDADLATLTAWVEAGAPEGEPIAQPETLAASTADEWTLGTPDLIIEPSEAFSIPASGPDVYRCFVIPTDLPDDHYVTAIEYKPGNRRVVHHVLSYIDLSGKARERDAADDGPGYACFSGPLVEISGDLGGWAPGNDPSRLPDGIGRKLPSKADVVMQVHYHPSGKAETDRTRIGLYFSKTKIKQTFHWSFVIGVNPEALKDGRFMRDGHPALTIPAGASNQEAVGRWVTPTDVLVHAVTPHMHLIGKDMTIVAERPDGKKLPLIKIPDWDFGWQNTYYFAEPVTLPTGTKVSLIAHFDNSADNPNNPNTPPKTISWGEDTTDEMCIGFFGITKAGQDLTRGDADDLRQILEAQRSQYQKSKPAKAD